MATMLAAPVVHGVAPSTHPAYPGCKCGSESLRGLVAGWERPEQVVRVLHHVRAARQLARRARVSWHVAIDVVHAVPDLTGGVWPFSCAARAKFQRPGQPVSYQVVCTRGAGHTGRHAAGQGGRVVAVWSGPRS